MLDDLGPREERGTYIVVIDNEIEIPGVFVNKGGGSKRSEI